MKKIVLALTLLVASTMGMASDEVKAQNAIMKVLTIKVKQELTPLAQTGSKKIIQRLKNKFGSDKEPTAFQKSVGAFGKVVSELANPEYTHKTINSETKFKIQQFKSLTIDYKNKKSDLKFNFKTNGKDASFGLGMSF